jgi:hypothetical protein
MFLIYGPVFFRLKHWDPIDTLLCTILKIFQIDSWPCFQIHALEINY